VNLYCDTCHTCWVEAVVNPLQRCPFVDCDGTLRLDPPKDRRVKVKYIKPKDYPLLERSEAE